MVMLQMAVACALFVGMLFFYAMLPIASLLRFPIIFFACISLLVGIWEEAGGYRG